MQASKLLGVVDSKSGLIVTIAIALVMFVVASVVMVFVWAILAAARIVRRNDETV